MTQRTEPYSDIHDLIEDSLDELARRRAKWPGDDLQAFALLADLVNEAANALDRRVKLARAKGIGWARLAEALGTTPTEVCIRFEADFELEQAWLH